MIKMKKNILGIAFQESKKVARETHPIAPQLDRFRPLLGQGTIPDFSAVASPTEKVLFQISVIEYGLRHGGRFKSTFNWSL